MDLTTTSQQNNSVLEQVLVGGNLAQLTPEQRTNYLFKVCDSLKLNPYTKPFEYITLNGKLTLYAKKDATDQLRKVHNVSITITSRETIEGVCVVTAKATTPDGRTDESIGAVSLQGAKGDALANLYMKAETKAKRRVTLSICGLGMLDETEVETIPEANHHAPHPQVAAPVSDPAHYVVRIGKKYSGKMLKDIPSDEIEGFLNWLKNESEKKKEPLTGTAAEFARQAEAYLGEQEFSQLGGVD